LVFRKRIMDMAQLRILLEKGYGIAGCAHHSAPLLRTVATVLSAIRKT